MEYPTVAKIILHIETNKGQVLHHPFDSHAELFDFVCDYILGDSTFDELSRLIQHTTGEWAHRGEHYKGAEAHKLWHDIGDALPIEVFKSDEKPYAVILEGKMYELKEAEEWQKKPS